MRNDPSNRKTLGNRRSGRVGTYLLVLLFASTAVPVYLWGQPMTANPSEVNYTAVLHLASSAKQEDLRRKILAPANLDRAIRKLEHPSEDGQPQLSEAIELARGRMRVSVTPAAARDCLRVEITYPGPVDDGRGCRLVNELATEFAEQERSRLEAAARRDHLEAQNAADQARKNLLGAQAQFDAFLEDYFSTARRERSSEAAQGADTPSSEPTRRESPVARPAENPEWVETKRRLDDMRRHRERLLIDRTAEHPWVKHSDLEIVKLQKRLAAIPHELVPSPSDLSQELKSMINPLPVPPGPVAPPVARAPVTQPGGPTLSPTPGPELVQTFVEKRRELDRARQTYQRAAEVERKRWESWVRLPDVDVELAGPCDAQIGPTTSTSDSGPSARLLTVSLAVGLAGALGVVMFSAGVAGEPTFANAAQARAMLPVPVVGVVPAADPPQRKTGRRRRRFADGWILVACGLLLLALCLGVMLAAFWGVQLG